MHSQTPCLRLKFSPSHSVEMATLFSKAHSNGPVLFPREIPDLQEDAATSPSHRLPHAASTGCRVLTDKLAFWEPTATEALRGESMAGQMDELSRAVWQSPVSED